MATKEKMNPKKTARILEDVKINVKIKLAALWVTLMFFYLYADVLAFYQPGHIEDVISGEVVGIQINQVFLLGAAMLMAIPSVMVFLSLTLKYPAIRWVTIIAAILLLGVNLIGLPGYPSAYDKFLIVVGLGFNALTIWYAWKWVA